LTGKCSDADTTGLESYRVANVIIPDGEVRFDFKVVSGQDRAFVSLGFRQQEDSTHYSAVVGTAPGWAAIFRTGTTIATSGNLDSMISRDNWNTLAVRMRGSDLWMLVNDQLVLQANDTTYDRGLLTFTLGRLGDINDTSETAAVFRNLRISSLENGEPSRVPTLQQAPAAVP
jgi:hypothetical protein